MSNVFSIHSARKRRPVAGFLKIAARIFKAGRWKTVQFDTAASAAISQPAWAYRLYVFIQSFCRLTDGEDVTKDTVRVLSPRLELNVCDTLPNV